MILALIVVCFIAASFQPLLALIVAIIGIPLPVSWPYYMSFVYLGEALFAVTVIGFAVHSVRRKKWPEVRGTDLVKAFLPFMIIGLISALWNMRMPYFKTHRAIGQLLIWAELPVAYCLIRNTIQNRKTAAVVVHICFITAALFSAAALAVYYIRPESVTNASGRLDGGFDSSNTMAAYINTLLPVGIGIFLATRRTMRKIGIGLLSVFVLLALLKTFSRGAIISLFVGLSAWMLYMAMTGWHKKAMIALLLFVTCSTIVMVPVFRQSTLLERLYRTSSLSRATKERVLFFRHAIALSRRYPLFGAGPGNYLFATRAKAYRYTCRRRIFLKRFPSHNLYLQVFAETGIFGLAAFFYFLIKAGAMILQSLRLLREEEGAQLLGMGLALTFFLFLCHGFADVPLRHGIAVQLGFNLGLLGIVSRFKKTSRALLD